MIFLLSKPDYAVSWEFLSEHNYLFHKQIIRRDLTEETGREKPPVWHAAVKYLMPNDSRDLLYSILMTALAREEFAFVRSCFDFHLTDILKNYEWTLLLTHVLSPCNTVSSQLRLRQVQFFLTPDAFQTKHADVCEPESSLPPSLKKLLWNPWGTALRSGYLEEAKLFLINHRYCENKTIEIEGSVYQTESAPHLLEAILQQDMLEASLARCAEQMEQLHFLIVTTKQIYKMFHKNLPPRQQFSFPAASSMQEVVNHIVLQTSSHFQEKDLKAGEGLSDKNEPPLHDESKKDWFLSESFQDLSLSSSSSSSPSPGTSPRNDEKEESEATTPTTDFFKCDPSIKSVPLDLHNTQHLNLLQTVPEFDSFLKKGVCTFWLYAEYPGGKYWGECVFQVNPSFIPKGHRWIVQMVRKVHRMKPAVFTDSVLELLRKRLSDKIMKRLFPLHPLAEKKQ